MKSAEVEAVRTGAGFYDASGYAVIRVAGADAAIFLHGLTTNDAKGLPIGKLQYSSLLDRKGHVESLFSLLRVAEDSFLILVQPDLKEKTTALLKKMVFIQEITITDESEKWGLIWIVGPQALDKVGEAFGLHGDMLAAENKVIIPPDKTAWNFWQSQRWGTFQVSLLLPRGEGAETVQLLTAVGLQPITKEVIDLVRLEQGVPEYGLEIDNSHLLLEANLNDSFVRNKGCYPGQEVVERICAYGSGKTPYKLGISYSKGRQELQDKSVVRTLYDPLEDRTLVAAYVRAE